MPEFFTILIKVNVALILFCLGYYLVLRKLTFYTLNRAYLVTAILFSSAYPFIDLSVLALRHQAIIAPVQNVVIIWQAPAENLVKQAAYWNWLEIAFWTGVAMFAVRLLFQMVSLYKIHARSTAKQISGQAVRVVNGDISPFSFWKSIYINPAKLSASDLQNVLAHEQVHVEEWHTLDILLTEISVIFYWFNPGIWMMKKAVRENIEFITDRKLLQKGVDSKTYQYSLLSITFNRPAPAITSSFNFSTLKKRIQMMNAKRSSKITLTRYALVVPIVVVSLLCFSLSKAEIVKTSRAYKAVAAAVDNMNKAVLNTDTVPATSTVTGTVTIKKSANGTKKTIKLTGAAVNNLTVEIDSPTVQRHSVTITGKKPGQKDSVVTYSIAGKPMSTFNSNFSAALTFNLDSTTLRRNTMLKGLTTYDYRTTSDGLIYVSAPDKAMAQSIPGLTYKGDTLKGNIKYYNNLGFLNGETTKTTEKTVVGYPSKSKSTTGSPEIVNQAYKFIEGNPIQQSNGVWSVVVSDPKGMQITRAQPLFIVDGKEVNQKDLKSFEGNVFYLSPETAIFKYGKKGEAGALIITTKDAKK